MKKIKTKTIKSEFGGLRLITMLTPNTFLRKIKVISTLINLNMPKGIHVGETTIGQGRSLNYLTLDIRKIPMTVLKKHYSINEAISFHIKIINESKFIDCESISEEVKENGKIPN